MDVVLARGKVGAKVQELLLNVEGVYESRQRLDGALWESSSRGADVLTAALELLPIEASKLFFEVDLS
jgi:hypothetical protein